MTDQTSHGWQTDRSPSESHRYMLEQHVACDVIIKFPSESSGDKELAAHKYMLICRSPVFEAMLAGSFQERDQTVNIVDVEAGVFMELLKFVSFIFV